MHTIKTKPDKNVLLATCFFTVNPLEKCNISPRLLCTILVDIPFALILIEMLISNVFVMSDAIR